MPVTAKLSILIIGIFSILPLRLVSKPGNQDYAGLRKQAEPSLVHIHSKRVKKDGTGADENSYGTGFIVDKAGHVLTASHVVLKADSQTIVETTVSIRSKQATRYKVETVKREEEVDLILLLLPDVGANWIPLEFGNSNTTPNDEPLYTLGFPGSLDLSSATGILSNKSGPNGTWQTTLPINRGNSGGPVFDRMGRVVAIAKGGDDAQQGITYAIPASSVYYVMPITPPSPDQATLDAFLKKGDKCYDERDYYCAITEYSKVIAVDHDVPLLYIKRGHSYFNLSKYDPAIDDYSKAIRLGENAFNDRANAYINKGENQRAISDYTEAIKLNGGNGWYFFNRATAYKKVGDGEKAKADCDKAHQLDRGLPDC